MPSADIQRKFVKLQSDYKQIRQLYERAPFGYQSLDEQGQLLEVNQTWLTFFGFSREEVIGKKFSDFLPLDWKNHFNEHFHKFKSLGEVLGAEFDMVRKDDRVLTVAVDGKIERTPEGHFQRTHCILHDVTVRKRAETHRDLNQKILQIVTSSANLSTLMQRVVETLQLETGFEAVGLRLQEGNDFPYAAHKGFADDFPQQEDSLICRTKDGTICRDTSGKVRLRCTCGLVLAGNPLPGNQFFSRGGSFWCNNAQQLFDLLPGEDTRFQPRTTCLAHGYASLVLTPIRNQGDIIGLLHMADHRTNCLSLDLVETLEGIATHIGAAIARAQAEGALLSQRKRMADIIDFLPDATFAIDTSGHIIIWNQAMETMTGLSARDMLGRGQYAYSRPFYGESRPQLIDLVFSSSTEIETLYPYIHREGDTLSSEVYCKALNTNRGGWVFAKASPLRDQSGTIIGAIESIRDITEKKKNEDRLKKNLARLEALFNATSDSVMLITPEGAILDLNENASRRLGICKDTLLGQNLFDFLPPEAGGLRREAIEEILTKRQLVEYEEHRGGRHFRLRLFPVLNDQAQVVQVASFSRDITEKRRLEEEAIQLQAQLHQAQKMESVGRLAGGVAHDFNNMLGVIIGYAEQGLRKTKPADLLHEYFQDILEAGTRSADITRQLLAFARKQTIAPKVLDLNETVGDLLKMLRRLLGEDIHLAWTPTEHLQPVKIDPSQIDQLLANLCVNARDAIDGVGKITIETGKATFDAAYCATHLGFIPGSFALLAVSDDGCGMDKETLDKAFEPFFTTKESGLGTGLGLAMVYGIVKQNKGFINIYSEPGQGTTIKIYLPFHEGELEVSQQGASIDTLLGQGETVLVVEDESVILKMTRSILMGAGYTVFTATSPLEALRFAEEHRGPIHLLVTDVVMPEMNGRDLATQLEARHPGIATLFMSGYTANVIAHRGILKEGVQFIPKPFSVNDFTRKIREVLDMKASSSRGTPLTEP